MNAKPRIVLPICLLAFVALVPMAFARGHQETPDPCKMVQVPERRWNLAGVGHAVAVPFRAIGTGFYYFFQGPRMAAELLVFGQTGEHVADITDSTSR